MTAPAPRNHPTEDAHPALTPAPVAVPEGGWRDQYVVRRGDGVVMHRRDGRWYSTASGISTTDEQIDVWIEDGDAWVLDGPVTPRPARGSDRAPRPEPVVAPLPSEAVEALAAVIRKARMTAYPDGKDGWLFRDSSDAEMADAVLAAGYRLVPEDDEDTGDVGVLHPLHEACGWQIGPMPDIKANRDFCREQVAEHREACPGKPADDEDGTP